jgi:citrate synthase
MLAVYSYHAYNHYIQDDSLYIHRPDPKLSTAENILLMLRPDKKYTALEAEVLDIALVLHMEHGGGNNSTFTTRVVTSAGSDTYSVMAAALSSLKGPKHGGANIKVVEMMDVIRKEVSDWSDEDEVKAYLGKIVDKQAFDKKGLIYGMGHAVYSLSDPRARVFKHFVEELAIEKGREKDFALYSMIERLAPEVIAEKRKIYKGVSANVDFYSGFVYSMLDIPLELYTPIFAMARIVGWSAHRIEELVNVDKIIRPAYKSVMEERNYIKMEDR